MTPRIHLVNPSHVSFGVAVITPRWLYVLAAATGAHGATRIIVDETLDPLDSTTIAAGRRRRHRHPHRQRAARLRSRASWRASAAPGSSTAAFTPRCSPTKRTSTARRTPSSKATAIWSGAQVVRRLPRRKPRQPMYDGGPRRRRRVPCRRAGTCCPRAATCGRRCRRCAAARSTARSVRCGAPTVRSRGSATSIASSGDRRPAAPRASGSSRSPTTISIRSRSRISRMARRRADKTRLHELEAHARTSGSS